MSESSQSAESVKQEVFRELETLARFDESGREAAEAIWSQTLGTFFASGERQFALWRVSAVKKYAMSAVRDIAAEAQRLAGGGLVTRAHMDTAAKTIIGKYRPPVEIGSSPLCDKFRLS